MEEQRIITAYTVKDSEENFKKFCKKLAEKKNVISYEKFYSHEDDVLHIYIENDEFVIEIFVINEDAGVSGIVASSLLSGYSVIKIYCELISYLFSKKVELSLVGGDKIVDLTEETEFPRIKIEKIILEIFNIFREKYKGKPVKCKPYETKNYIHCEDK